VLSHPCSDSPLILTNVEEKTRKFWPEHAPNDWWRNTSRYALYLALPRGAWRRDNCIVDLADCPRGHWYGPDYLLHELAHLHHDGHAQWLADQIDRAGVASAEAAWLNLFWFDPGVLPVPPDGLPTLRHFADMGLAQDQLFILTGRAFGRDK